MSNPADKLLQRARAADLLRSKGLLTDKEMADVIHEAVHKATNPKEVDSDDGGAEPMIPRDKVAEAISRQAEWEAVSIPYPKIERMAGAAIGAHMEALSETGHAVVKLADSDGEDDDGQEYFGDFEIRVDHTARGGEHPRIYIGGHPSTPDAARREAAALLAAAAKAES